jgi:homoserine kinase type II
MKSDRDPAGAVLACWPVAGVTRREALGSAGGFSGANLWRIATPEAIYCLRRWPPSHPTRPHLDWMHAVLRQVVAGGCSFVPAPLVSRDRGTWVEADGSLWELTPWMPGEASYRRQPTREKLESALTAVACWHQAARGSSGSAGRSAGLARRRDQLQTVSDVEICRLQRAVDRQWGHSIEQMALQILGVACQIAESLRAPLARAVAVQLELQPCIRDVWHEHVLFSEQQVSGIVDYGAMGTDTVVGDVARLLGSMVGDDPVGWKVGLEAYQRIRPLTSVEEELVAVFDRSNYLLGGLNWVRWLFVERRHFDNQSGVVERISEIAHRLRGWCE